MRSARPSHFSAEWSTPAGRKPTTSQPSSGRAANPRVRLSHGIWQQACCDTTEGDVVSMRARSLFLCCIAVTWFGYFAAGAQTTNDALDVVRPCVTLGSADVARLTAGRTIVKSIPEEDGYVATFGARRVNADGDRLVAWIREIAQLKRGRFVESIQRFSDPPVIGDLARLTLDDSDLLALRNCRPSECDVKVTPAELERLRRDIAGAGEAWRSILQESFRQLMLARVQAYATGGHGAVGQYCDGRSPLPLEAVFASILTRSPCLTARLPEAVDYLKTYPRVDALPMESFIYWSKERFGGRPVISATHTVIVRGTGNRGQDAIVFGKQLFATHYSNGSLNMTAVVGNARGSERYLVILNRTNVDLLHGLFGGLTRFTMERRLRSELSGVLDELARRIESGLPGAKAPSPRN